MMWFAAKLRSTLLSLVLAAAALPCAAHPLAGPPTPPDFAADRFLIGKWSCEAEAGGRIIGREDAVYDIALGGHWLRLAYTMQPTDARERATTTHAYETFDKSLRKWVYFSVSSDGTYGTVHSDGWQNGRKSYTPAGERQAFRLVATKVGENAFTQEVLEPQENGAWKSTWLLRCKRVPAP
jgi:hypothetical protein